MKKKSKDYTAHFTNNPALPDADAGKRFRTVAMVSDLQSLYMMLSMPSFLSRISGPEEAGDYIKKLKDIKIPLEKDGIPVKSMQADTEWGPVEFYRVDPADLPFRI